MLYTRACRAVNNFADRRDEVLAEFRPLVVDRKTLGFIEPSFLPQLLLEKHGGVFVDCGSFISLNPSLSTR